MIIDGITLTDTGILLLSTDPDINLEAATKQYVDSFATIAGTGITKTGTTLSVNQTIIPYDIASGIDTKPTASQNVLKFKVCRAFTFPTNMTNSQTKALIAATASAVWIIQKNGITVATFTFAAASTVATWSTQAAISFSIGDVLDVISPATVDATLTGIYFTLAAYLS